MKLPNVKNLSRSVVKFIEDRVSHPKSSKDITFDDLRRFKTSRLTDPDSHMKIRVKGPGIQEGVTILPNNFQIDIRDLDIEPLTVEIQGPSYIKLDHKLEDSGIIKISYQAQLQGTYDVEIKYKGVDVPGSPFQVNVKECKVKPVPVSLSNHKSVRAYGKGLKFSKQGEIASFEIDTRKAGEGRLYVYLDCPDARLGIECKMIYTVTKNGCKVEYVCPNEGSYYLRVKYDGRHIKGSPFHAQCLRSGSEVPGLFSSFKRNALFNDGKRPLAVL